MTAHKRLPVIVLDRAGMKTSLTAFCTTSVRRPARWGAWRATRPRWIPLVAATVAMVPMQVGGRAPSHCW